MTPTNTPFLRSIFTILASACAVTAGCDDPDLYGDDPDLEIEAAEGPDGALPAELPGGVAPPLDQLQVAPPLGVPRFPCRILPLGDSITYGYNGNFLQELNPYYWGGYRAHLVAGFALTPSATVGTIKMVGVRIDHSNPTQDAMLQSAHSGYPGHTSAELAVAVDTGATNVAPDIILLHTGTNDMIEYPGPNQHLVALGNLNVLLNLLALKNPSAKILLAKILPMGPLYNAQVNAYNAQLDAVAAARRLMGQQVWIVDHNTLFPAANLPDSIHPDWTGYADMAARWRLALDALGC